MNDSKDINSYMNFLGSKAKEAAKGLSQASTIKKNEALISISKSISSRKKEILDANSLDLKNAKDQGIGDALFDRLKLTEERVDAMITGINEVITLKDPIGEVIEMDPTPSGIKVSKMRVPLGVVGIVYESRPNVTSDAAALCLKSGNAVILRGGSEAILSNKIISECLRKGLTSCGFSEDIIQLVDVVDREAVKILLNMKDYIDVVIPRGGKDLVKLVSNEAKVPVIKHLEGICHVYIDQHADYKKSLDISINAKTYRYGICGAMETLLISSTIAEDILPAIQDSFQALKVQLRGCDKTCKIISIDLALPEDWITEYLAPVLSIKIVDNIEEAIEHINTFGSGHTDAIITENQSHALKFIHEVDSSSVMHNLPTCWADGFEYGLGAEIGISTDRLHARGPVGLEGLTSQKFVVKGNAELRGS